MQRYNVLTVTGQDTLVYAREHTLEEGVLTLYNTHEGVHIDVFPKEYWSRFAVNGVEQKEEEIEREN